MPVSERKEILMAYAVHTLKATAERIRQEMDHDPWSAVRDFRDGFFRADTLTRQHLMIEEPAPTGDPRFDAYLAALAEHLAYDHGLDRPAWTCHPSRFLDRMWFPNERRDRWAAALVRSPAAFRRRSIFVDPREVLRC